jgi:hypothetical protein
MKETVVNDLVPQLNHCNVKKRSKPAPPLTRSGLVQIPAPILLADFAHELAVFGAFDR